MCLHELKSEAPIKDTCYGYILFIKVQLNPYLKTEFVFMKKVFEIIFLVMLGKIMTIVRTGKYL